MKRKALLIMNPGREGVNYVPSVLKAYERYKNFLMSPIGGYWSKSDEPDETEILELDRLNGGVCLNSDFVFKLKELNKPDVDYSMIVFIGHGGAARGIDSFQLEDGEIISIKDVACAYGNANSIKRTIVVDACRSYVDINPSQLILEKRQYSGDGMIDGIACRDFYNRLISEVDPHVELIQSTQYNQVACGSPEGTAFTDALFDTLSTNNKLWNQQALMDRLGEFSQSYPDMWNDIKKRMIAYSQVPQFTSSSPRTVSFPLCALKRATRKIIEGGAVVGVLND